MTANELFLKHAAKHLGQYQGNLRWFCEAVENGHVPAADDDTIRPHVKLLKQRMGIATASDEDEFLLRFGLIVPGLARGIRPPVAVLNSERGGFSEKRLEQAAGQATRLREAMRVGCRYFSDLSNNTVTALRELATYLATGNPSDPEWIELHANLSDVEARLLADRAFTCLDDSSESNDLGVSILTCLANFRREGLGGQLVGVLSRKLLWPSSIYRDAPDDVANRLIQQIEADDGGNRNHLLLAIAWTRGEPARRAFAKWRNTPPPWANKLNIPPENYRHDAGWTLDAKQQRKDLISLSCHRIALATNASAPHLAVSCRTEVEKHFPACGGPLGWLFDFGNLPDEFFSGDRLVAPRRILCCLHCAAFCPAVFSRYQPDGSADWHPATKSEETSNLGGGPQSTRELVASPQSPFAAAEPFGIQDATALGGVPMWVQGADYPHCPDCQDVMTFLAQFDNGSMTPPEEGIYYAFFCGKCRVAAVNYQQT